MGWPGRLRLHRSAPQRPLSVAGCLWWGPEARVCIRVDLWGSHSPGQVRRWAGTLQSHAPGSSTPSLEAVGAAQSTEGLAQRLEETQA